MSQKNYKVNEAIEIVYQTTNGATGKTVNMEVYDEGHVLVGGGPIVLTELGVTGRYYGPFTPDAVGEWSVQVQESDGSGKATRAFSVGAYDLDDVGGQADAVKADTASIISDVAAVDTLIDGVVTDVAAVDTKVDTVDSKIVTVDGKVDTVDAKVVTATSKIDAVDTLVDGVVTDVAAVKSDTASIVTSVGTVDTKVVDLDTDVVAVKSDTVSIIADIATVDGKIDGLGSPPMIG